MIQKVDDSFPVPVSGKPIQRGWFGALVRFVNSLRLRGDGRYFMVSRNLGGTTIQPSTALLQALDRSGGAAPSAGGGGGTSGPSWKPYYPGRVSVTPVISDTYVVPTASTLFKPTSDGWFYIQFRLWGPPTNHLDFSFDVYSSYPVGNPSIGPTETNQPCSSYFYNNTSCSLWYPALKDKWYYFFIQASTSDQGLIWESIHFYPVESST